MRMLREWIHRLLGTLRIARRDDDLADELRLHLELAAEDAGRRGDDPAAAVRPPACRTATRRTRWTRCAISAGSPGSTP